MQPLRRLSLIEQTAGLLRDGLRSGRWAGYLPGVLRLAAQLDVSKGIVRAALRLLEMEGHLSLKGRGHRRAVVSRGNPATGRSMRIAVLLRGPLLCENTAIQRLLLELKHTIESAGHLCVFVDGQLRLGESTPRIARLVKATPADGWVVLGAPAKLLGWFSAQARPAMALGGRWFGSRIAATGSDFKSALKVAVRSIVTIGHRRIVMVCPRLWRLPTRGLIAGAFAAELAAHGIPVDEYNLPDWEENPEGLQHLLHALFLVTPPTALIFVEPAHVVAAIAFLAARGLRIPQDLSIVCMADDPALAWCRPKLSCLRSDDTTHIRRILRWIRSLAQGSPTNTQKLTKAEFVVGGSIGPARTHWSTV